MSWVLAVEGSGRSGGVLPRLAGRLHHQTGTDRDGDFNTANFEASVAEVARAPSG